MSDQISPIAAKRFKRHTIQLGMAALICVSLLAGCGRANALQRAPVDGYVSIDGQPLQSGSIRFIPTENTKGPAAVANIDEGYFELPRESGPVIGKHRIEIEATNHLGFDLDDEQAYARTIAQGQQLARNPVPESFNRQSRLVIELSPEGQLDLNFRLTSAGVLASSN